MDGCFIYYFCVILKTQNLKLITQNLKIQIRNRTYRLRPPDPKPSNKPSYGKKAISRLLYTFSIFATFLLALLTVGGWYAQYVSPASSALFPLLGLALPGLLVLNVLAILYWAVRWRYWVWVPLLAIVANWDYLSSIYQFGHQTSAQGEILRVATYNIDSFGNDNSGTTCRQVAQVMRDQQADIICFQEFRASREFPMDSILSVFDEWPYCAVPYSREPLLQLAILSRYPIADSQLIKYEQTANCSMWCDIAIGTDTIRVFNNHLQTTNVSQNKRKLEKELATDNRRNYTHALTRLFTALQDNFILRAQQTDTVKELVTHSPHSVILCGDLNSPPSSYTYRTLRKAGLRDGFHTAGKGYMYTFRYLKKILRIDYIFHSDRFQGINYYSPDLEYSDHNPVCMEVILR